MSGRFTLHPATHPLALGPRMLHPGTACHLVGFGQWAAPAGELRKECFSPLWVAGLSKVESGWLIFFHSTFCLCFAILPPLP